MTVRQSQGFPLNVYVHSDVGRVRTNNEDSFGKQWLSDGSLFVIVADGMGGHEAGEVASGLAVQVVEEVVQRDLTADPRERLYNGLLEANEAIMEEGRASGTRGMGTTAIAGLILGNEVHIGQVGDSRLYHIRRGHMIWRTLDHTRVQMLIDSGEISDEEARNHPEAGMLTRALGHARMVDGRPLAPDVLAEPLILEPEDTVILCSDGLHDLMDDWEIAHLVGGKSPEEAARALVEEACGRGGHDNVTVAVIVAGERAGDYDPDFIPDTYLADETGEGLEQAEVTFDELPTPGPRGSLPIATAPPVPQLAATGVMAPPIREPRDPAPDMAAEPASEAQPARTGMVMAMGAMGALIVVLLVLLLVAGLGVAALVLTS